MTTLLLVRHATTAATGSRLGGRTETPLDERGREQAAALAERLAPLPLKAVYSSPLARTAQTAAAIAARHRLEVVCDDGLLEVDYGRWTDRPLKALYRTRLWPVIAQRPSLVQFPDGESIRGAQQRAVEAVEALVARHPRQVVAAVTHADVIKAVVAFYLGLPLDLFQRIAVAPASVTVLRLPPGGQPLLQRLGDDGPLTPEAVAPPPRHRSQRGGQTRTARGSRGRGSSPRGKESSRG
ncbi:MAG TPA: MSMEG_4193 family putative phosphomutase [Egibacteraceae bacterium]